jgi:hypothetical protein
MQKDLLMALLNVHQTTTAMFHAKPIRNTDRDGLNISAVADPPATLGGGRRSTAPPHNIIT